MIIDSHAHLAGDRFADDRDAVLQRAWDAGVEHIVVIGDLTTSARDLAARFPGRLSFTAGLHPHEAATFTGTDDVETLRELLSGGAVAVGECGLDSFYDHSPRDLQLRAFETQLALAAEFVLPVVVHTREAEADTLRLMQAAARTGVVGVLHCFTGSPELARAALDVGWYISISGIATFRNWERDDVVRLIPDDRLLVETDAPYLAPVPCRGKRNESAFLQHTVAHLARVRGVTPETLADSTARNAIRLFNLSVSAR